MWGELVAAGIGVVGALAGVGVGAKLEADALSRRDLEDARAGAKLVDAELRTNLSHLSQSWDEHANDAVGSLRRIAWETHGLKLTRLLDQKTLGALTRAYHSIDIAPSLVHQLVAEQAERSKMLSERFDERAEQVKFERSSAEIERIEELLELHRRNVEDGLDALAPVIDANGSETGRFGVAR